MYPCGACYGLRDVNCLTCGRRANQVTRIALDQARKSIEAATGSIEQNLTRWSQHWQNEAAQKRLELLYGI